jgi:hypothetical protein
MGSSDHASYVRQLTHTQQGLFAGQESQRLWIDQWMQVLDVSVPDMSIGKATLLELNSVQH